MDKICNSNNAQWITLYIKNYTKLHFHILVFVFKSHSQIIKIIISEKKVEKKKECIAGIQTRDFWLARSWKKKKKNALPAVEAGMSDLGR